VSLESVQVIEYIGIQLNKNGKGKTFSIHRLVALSFLLNDDSTKIVNHKDGDKENNNVSNLYYYSLPEEDKKNY
jgi:hypothetical protein